MSQETVITLETENAAHVEETPPADDERQSTNEHRIWSKLPQLLRWIGGVSLAGSAITFLLGGWMNAEPLVRYYSFFALTSALSLAGLFCATRLKEDKGARTFLSLGAAFIPVLFCQLGALVYAQVVGSASQFSEYMEIFRFPPIGLPMLVGTLALAAAALTAFAFFGFSAMARPEAKRLTAVYILSNATLLLPFRSDAIVATLGFALLAGLIFVDRRFFAKRSVLRTWDGRAMRSLLYVPFALLLTRSALLYDVSGIIVSLLFTAIAALFFIGLPQLSEKLSHKRTFQHLSLAPLFVAWTALFDPLLDLHINARIDEFTTFILLPLAGVIALLSRFVAGSGRSFRLIAGLVAVGASAIQLLIVGGALAAILSLALGVLVVVLSYPVREKGLLILGLSGTVFALAYHVRYAADFYQSNLWLSLAATGVAVILAASYIERNWQKLLVQGKDIREKLHDWN